MARRAFKRVFWYNGFVSPDVVGRLNRIYKYHMEKKILFWAGVAVVVMVVVGVGAFFFFGGFNEGRPRLPKGWTYQESKLCGVDIPLPPKEDPYITVDRQEYWTFQEARQDYQGIFFPDVAVAMLQNPEKGGSGYVAGAVIVSCGENTHGEIPEEAAARYAAHLENLNQEVPPEARVTLVSKEKTTLWGKEVQVVGLSGGMFTADDRMYIATTKDMVYFISHPQMSQDAFVRQTTETVFNNLKFR